MIYIYICPLVGLTKIIYTCHLFVVPNMPVNSKILLQVASTHTLWENNVVSTAKFA